MDLAPLSAAYDRLLADASTHSVSASAKPDGGWSAAQVLAHIVIGDRDFASLCAQLRWGLTPTYDNRASQTPAYLDAVVRAAGSWPALVDGVRRGSAELLDVLASLSDSEANYKLTFSGVAGDRELGMTMSVTEFAAGLAARHLPSHHEQLLALAAVPA
jgi:uncharacterized damage-inducible protein DinB